MLRIDPLMTPYVRIASTAYSEQVGSNLQLPRPKYGETACW